MDGSNVDRIDIRVLRQVLVVTVGDRNAEFGRILLCFASVSTGNRDDLC